MAELTDRTLNSDQALAFGALESGVRLVTSYPGSPSAGTVATLIDLSRNRELYVEWSSNEKVAIEMGIGASIAGRRALVCAKSVGMNLMVDPLMVLNLTPVKGGLVILLGDDPGAYGSQNDQDTRQIALMLEIPILEPASPTEGYAMMREAFSISEKLNTAVIIRETRSFTQQTEVVSIAGGTYPEVNLGFAREPWRFVPVPRNAVEKHRQLHERLEDVSHWVDGSPFNHMEGAGARGILAAGFVYRKLLEVLGDSRRDDVRILKLGAHYPLPENMVKEFLAKCEEVLILEENEPFIEMSLKALAFDLNAAVKIYGKGSGHVVREGELYRWQIQQALSRFLPDFVPGANFTPENEADELPEKENFCAEAGYGEVLDALQAAAQDLGQELILIGDPGCLVTVAERLDAKYAIGSAIGVADGMSKVNVNQRPVALFGDSAFFHTGLPAICNVVHNRSDILMVLLDNRSTASTGFQPNPGVGVDATGTDAPGLSIEQIARACGVRQVLTIDSDCPMVELKNAFKNALGTRKLALVLVRTITE